jgi:hypothetical protein
MLTSACVRQEKMPFAGSVSVPSRSKNRWRDTAFGEATSIDVRADAPTPLS